jgi:hypothetical protein
VLFSNEFIFCVLEGGNEMILCVSSRLSAQSEEAVRTAVAQCNAECVFVSATQACHEICTKPKKIKGIIIFGRVSERSVKELSVKAAKYEISVPMVGVHYSADAQDRLSQAGCTEICTEVELLHKLPRLLQAQDFPSS